MFNHIISELDRNIICLYMTVIASINSGKDASYNMVKVELSELEYDQNKLNKGLNQEPNRNKVTDFSLTFRNFKNFQAWFSGWTIIMSLLYHL